MTVTFPDSALNNTTVNTTSLSFASAALTGIQAGDYLILICTKDDDPAFSLPSGYSEAYQVNAATYDDTAQVVFYRKVNAGEISSGDSDAVTVTWADSEECSLAFGIVRGADQDTFHYTEQTALNENTNAPDSPNISGIVAGDMVLSIVGTRNGNFTTGATEPSGYAFWGSSTANVDWRLIRAGTGNGDSSQCFAWKEATGTSENPGAWGGFTNLRDYIATTFVIKAASSLQTIAPDLVQSLAAALDPTISPGVVNIDPSLIQQLAIAFDVEVIGGLEGSPSYNYSREAFVTSRLSSISSSGEWNAHNALGGVSIMVYGDNWHTGEGAFSASQETSIDASITHAHDNGYMLILRWMNGNRAPTWPTYGTEWDLIIREGDQPGTIPAWTDPEWERVYKQGLDRWVWFMEGDCPETASHTRAEHFHSLPVSHPSESSTEVSAQVGLKATYITEGHTLASGIDDTTTTLVLDSDPGGSWATGKWLLDIDGLTEQVQQLSRSGATITLVTDGRGWNRSDAVSHSSGVAVKRAASSTIFGPFVFLGRTTGYWDEGRSNDVLWTEEVGDDAARQVMILAAWKEATRWHMEAFKDVVRSDGSYLQQSVAGGNVFNDSWSVSDALIDEIAPKYGNRLVAMVTNFEEDYETNDPNAYDWMNRAMKGGAILMMQNRGTSGLPNTLAGLNDLIEAWEDSLQWWPLTCAEVQPTRLDQTDLGTTDAFKDYAGHASDEHSNYLLGQNRGSGSNASDHFQGRMHDWKSLGEFFTGINDETPITNINTIFDVVTINDHSIKADIKDGELAARVDMVSGIGGGDCMMRWSASYPDQRFATLDTVQWFDGYDGAVQKRFHRFRKTSGNHMFVRINLAGKIEIFDGSSILATSIISIATGQRTRITSFLRVATSGEADTGGLCVVHLWNDINAFAPTETIEATFTATQNTITAVDVGDIGRTSSSEAITFWVFEAHLSTQGFTKEIHITQDISPSLTQQLAAAIDPLVLREELIQPLLIQALAQSYDPTLTYNYNVNPAKADSLATAFDPSLLPGEVFITPALVDSSAVAFDPSITSSYLIVVDLVNQTAIVYDPVVDLSTPEQFITPGLEQQLVAVFSPDVLADTSYIILTTVDNLAQVFGVVIEGGEGGGKMLTMSDRSP